MNPKHHKSRYFATSGFFRGIKSFDQLEEKISCLPDNQTKGDAFEVFAEAYLATCRRYDAKDVWPLNAAPFSILENVSLGHQDYGVDGIFETHIGNLNAYQVKFRSNRHPLTWRELSTFVGLADSPNIHQRVLITNCNELPLVINDRAGFYCVRGSDFDRLEEQEFELIANWLGGVVVKHNRKSPLPHQKKALESLLPALQENDRVSAIMACGTGKTLLALWIAEQPQYKRVLVLVPSLALMRQTLHEWLKETKWQRMAYVCVCSDPTVKESGDSITTLQSDLDFPVNTDSDNVRRFLDAEFKGVKVVFTTYQSARVVSKALNNGAAFDLGIFDEAHKTAGRDGRNYALALQDENLPISKRLFLTATPRRYNPHKKTRDGDHQLVFSMDNPEVYGPQAFVLNFGEAARCGIICPYKVLISAITSEMVDNEIINRGEVLVKGDVVKARTVANQIAMKEVIEKYGAQKVFTFHKTVRSAGNFTGESPESISSHLEGFDLYHVNGAMPTAQRETVMKNFRRSDKAIISNARCLTEGVDVPAVDMVAFLSPRKSRVDIVQATGRAMRKSPGKKCGFILVPIYVEQEAGESIEAAVGRASYEEVWDVLQAMQEQDEALYDIVQQMAINHGRGRGGDRGEIGEKVQVICPELSIKALQESVTVRALEEFYESWSVHYGKLKAFFDAHGHTDVNTEENADESLRLWVNAQRTINNKGMMSAGRIKLLDELSFSWNWQEDKAKETWLAHYGVLKNYAEGQGHANMPRTNKEFPVTAKWVWIQRGRRKRPMIDDWAAKNTKGLNQEQIDLLDEIGFVWNPHDASWLKKFNQLKALSEEGKEVNQPTGKSLRPWNHRQRMEYQAGQLSDDRIQKLLSIGFDFEFSLSEVPYSQKNEWQSNYECLVSFKEKHEHVNVSRTDKEYPTLAAWLMNQRKLYREGKLDEEAISLLADLGFSLERQRDRRVPWEVRLEELLEYKRRFGDCRVAQDWKENPPLGKFVSSQRAQFKAGSINPDRVKILDEIGFEWEVKWTTLTSATQKRIAQLKAFRERHGHLNVRRDSEGCHGLKAWMYQVCNRRNKGKLDAEIGKALDEIGFEWEPESSLYEATRARVAELKMFNKAHGHWDPPRESVENPGLRQWVDQQRSKKRHGKLGEVLGKALNEIGFEW